MQPLLVTVPSVPVVAVGVSGPQLSVKVAVPSALLIVFASGLQAVIIPFVGVPVVVITGPCVSEVQVAVRDALAVLLQASTTIHVLVWVRVQPLLVIAPSTPVVAVGVSGPQLSVYVAVPRALLIVAASGLQAVMIPLAGVPVVTMDGA